MRRRQITSPMVQSQGAPCVLLIAFVWLAWATPTNDVGPTSILWPVGISLVSAAVAVRSLLLRVVVDDAGLRVVNFFWSKRVAWEEVARFEIDQGEMSPSIHAFVVCRDGSRVPVTALQTRWMQSVERARRLGLVVLAGLAALLVGLARLARVRTRADAAGLRLAGLLRSRRMPWAEVADFDVIRRRPLGWRAVLVGADGAALRLPGLGSRVTGRRHLDRRVAELAEIHADQREARQPVTAPSNR